jgi:hypothetical protein
VWSYRKNRGDPPQARSWPEYGGVDQEAVGEPPTGFETSGRVLARAEADGERLGSARAEKEKAVGEGSGAMQWIAGVLKARTGVIATDSLREKLAASQVIATKEPHLRANSAQVAAGKRRLERLQRRDLPITEKAVREQKSVVDGLGERYDQLPRHVKGYMSVWVLVAIEIGVVAFEGGALHTALTHAGFSKFSVVYLSMAVPVLLAAVNHGLGLLAGALGRALGPRRLKVALGVFAVGFGALVGALVLLTVLRSQATAAQNTANASWATGKPPKHPVALLSPVWLGPAQVAGSIVAITVVGFFTIAKEGRERCRDLREARDLLVEREQAVATVEADIEGAHRGQEALAVAAAEIETGAAEAQAALEAHDDIHAAKLKAEEGLAEAARGRLRTCFLYVARIYENGHVMKVALPTVFRFGRRYTPPPGDVEGEPYRPPKAGQNGHRQSSFDDLQPLIGD